MDLEKKLLIFVLVAAVFALAAATLVGQQLLLGDLNTFGDSSVKHTLIIARYMSDFSAQEVEAAVASHAMSDSAYAYMEVQDRNYTDEMFSSKRLTELGISYVCIYDSNGVLQFYTGYDGETGKAIGVPPELSSLTQNDPFLLGDRRLSLTGLVLTDDGPLQVSSHQIVPANKSDQPRGVMIFARPYDLSIPLAAGGSSTEIEVYSADDIVLSQWLEFDDDGHALEHTPEGVEGYYVLTDIYGDSALIVKVRESFISLFYSSMILKIQALSFGGSLIAGGLIVVLVYLWFSKPLKKLITQLNEIAAQPKKGSRMPISKEFAPLSNGINSVLAQNDSISDSLENSEMSYANLLEFSRDLIVIVNADGKITYSNRSFDSTLGYSRSSLSNRPLTQLMDKDAVKAFKAALASKEKDAVPFTAKITAKDGRTIHLSAIVSPSPRQEEEGLYIFRAKDMSEAVAAIAQSKHEQERAMSYFNSAAPLMATLDSKGSLVAVNDAALKALQTTKQNALGKSLQQFVAQKSKPEFIKSLKQAQEGKKLGAVELELGSKEPHTKVKAHFTALKDDAGAVHTIIFSGADLGPEEDMKWRLAEAGALNNALLASVKEGICIVDDKLKITYANAPFGRMLGLPMKKILGTKLEMHVAPSQRKQVSKHLLAKSGSLQDVELRGEKGKPVNVAFSCSVLNDGAGERIGALACFTHK